MKRVIQFPVTLDRYNRKKDRSVAMSFTTNAEVSNVDLAMLDTFMSQAGYLLFSENELGQEDVPAQDADTKQAKSKGQRMRAVFFLIWKKRGIDEPFDPWYERAFERYMDRWKEELD